MGMQAACLSWLTDEREIDDMEEPGWNALAQYRPPIVFIVTFAQREYKVPRRLIALTD